MASLGEKLKRLRKKKGYSLDQLATLSGASKSYLWELENREERKPSAEKLIDIARVLDTTTDFLVDDKATFDDAKAQEVFFRKFNRLDDDTKERVMDMIDLVGEEEMTLPTTWQGWAVRVSAYVREGKKLLNEPRFPVKIEEVAIHYSQSVFPMDPILEVKGENYRGKWEGALVPKDDRSGWGLFYDSGHASKGRKNFTMAHEFGHYLAHRHLTNKPFLCSRKDMYAWNSDYHSNGGRGQSVRRDGTHAAG